MRTRPFQSILCFLTLLGTAHASVAPTADCTTQAWARAPDLAPNAIVHGDARVKISAECPRVDHVSLGLRFKERSIMKVLRSRDDAKWLDPGPHRHPFLDASPWAPPPSRFANKSAEEAYEEVTTNKVLWIVREEERVVFETTRPINVENSDHGVLRDAVRDFVVLAPSTNFPPVLDAMMAFMLPVDREIAQVEWKYEYFAQISFSNGTTREIPAGFTAFQPLHDPTSAPQGPPSGTAELKPWSEMRTSPTKNLPIANYSIEISAGAGLTFSAGTKGYIINGVITRTGFARAFSSPLNVLVCLTSSPSPKWVAEDNMPDATLGFNPEPAFVLRAISDSKKPKITMSPGHWSHPQCLRQRDSVVRVLMPNSTLDKIEANEIVTTTSAAFTVSLDVEEEHIPTFETYYQTLVNSLNVILEIPRGADEAVDPDDPSNKHDSGWGPYGLQFEDDEEAWVPWDKKRKVGSSTWRSYSGCVPVVVHATEEGAPSQRHRHASTDASGQLVLSDETVHEKHSLIHYLNEGARGPTFVDRNAIQEVLSEDPAVRELRAPVLQPVVTSPPEGKELIYRYYLHTDARDNLIYVGETWAKKVAAKGGH